MDDFLPRLALERLDQEMAKNDYLGAFAPIDVVSTGGFLAVTYFKNRKTTGDIDYIMDPEWIGDNDIIIPMRDAIKAVARKNRLEYKWMNDDMQIWTNPRAREKIFEQALDQNILLWSGESIKIWAPPFEWALERKLRRIAYAADRAEKRSIDMSDAIALFRHFRKASGGPLDMEYYRTLNMNGFDLEPKVHHMERVAAHYKEMYNEELFAPVAQTAATTTTSYSETSTAYSSEASTAYYPQASTAGSSQAAEGTSPELSDEYCFVQEGKNYRFADGKAVEIDRPQKEWVYNDKGWKDTGRRKKWRYVDGNQISYR